MNKHVSDAVPDLKSEDKGKPNYDPNYAAYKLMLQLKRNTENKESGLDKCWKIVEVPFNFFRDFTIPMGDDGDWDRIRASILPLTMPTAFMFLNVLIIDEDESLRKTCYIIAGVAAVPGLLCAIYLMFCTKKTQAPPRIMFLYAVLGFVMSICWIAFTADFVIDLLWIIGLILSIPRSLLGLTLLAVGNCVGDMNANVAMCKKGFGEMAVTASFAGPVFNVLFGIGVSLTYSLLQVKEGE